MATRFTLPELGENISSGTVARVLVQAGAVVAKDQAVLEVETDKAVVEVPAPVAGTVKEMHATEGSTLRVGDLIAIIEESGAKSSPPPPAPVTESPRAAAPVAAPVPQAPAPIAPPVAAPAAPPPAAALPRIEMAESAGGPIAASPSVRRLAREIGVDISQVPLSERGRITIEDVKAFAKAGGAGKTVRADSGTPAAATGPLPDMTRWGGVRREAMSVVRLRTAERMTQAWTTIPHVTQQDKADITQLEEFRKRYGPRAEAKGGKLTVTAVLVKVLAAALKRFPQFNASIDMEHNEIVFKDYFNIGVAVDTDRGLLVPVIKGADRKSIVDIAAELNTLAAKARDRKLTLDDMQGGCITITNLGGIGGVGFTPIVNPPEVAILGVSRAAIEPVYRDGAFVPRTLAPLSLSYDHRLIDGADAARFTRWICEALEQPLLINLDA